MHDREGLFESWITFVYAENNQGARSHLWDTLSYMPGTQTKPWLIIGDFNVVLSCDEKVKETGEVTGVSAELGEWMNNNCVNDLRAFGWKWTWSNSHTSCKLDRAVVNGAWTNTFVNSSAHFDEPQISDRPLSCQGMLGIGASKTECSL